jgi:hypothetical protein
MKKHTLGPWRIERQNTSPTTGEWMIAGFTPGYLAEIRDCEGGKVEANAKLIAAAPDLLEALQYVAARLREIDGQIEEIVVYKAIKKATGEAE